MRLPTLWWQADGCQLLLVTGGREPDAEPDHGYPATGTQHRQPLRRAPEPVTCRPGAERPDAVADEGEGHEDEAEFDHL